MKRFSQTSIYFGANVVEVEKGFFPARYRNFYKSRCCEIDNKND